MIGGVLVAACLLFSRLFAPLLLPDTAWSRRWPRLGLAAWALLCVLTVLAVSALGLTAADPVLHGDRFFLLSQGCWETLWGQSGSQPVVALSFTGGLLLGIGAPLRALWAVGRALLRDRRTRLEHIVKLDLIGAEHPARRPGATRAVLLQDARPTAYCLPGRGGRIVLTSGALRSLTPEALAAVLEHEHSHLRGRHHQLLVVVGALASSLPWIPVLGTARRAMARLTELAADDAAARRHGKRAVARGLAGLIASTTGPATRQAAGHDVKLRLARLTAADGRPGRCEWLMAAAGLGLTATGPFIATVGLWWLCC
ncbi:M56 family metallopeptidase [Streptomyces sp. NPDC048172]|uniref:M56 family metallopeptidase n=1 Tax=Streptomyces sp. NPDC048172 TaxID=3365505 RepID=UPI003710F94E